jgi:hypothetical protein
VCSLPPLHSRFTQKPNAAQTNPATGAKVYSGREIRVLETIAAKLNFRPEYVEPSDNQQWGVMLRNGSMTGMKGDVQVSTSRSGLLNVWNNGCQIVWI